MNAPADGAFRTVAVTAESVGMLIRGNDRDRAEGVGAFPGQRPPGVRRAVPKDPPDIVAERGTRGA